MINDVTSALVDFLVVMGSTTICFDVVEDPLDEDHYRVWLVGNLSIKLLPWIPRNETGNNMDHY